MTQHEEFVDLQAGLTCKVNEVLSRFDNSDEAISEVQIYDALRTLRPSDDIELPLGYSAETMAFAFCDSFDKAYSPWNTFYGPLLSCTAENGDRFEYPSLQQINCDILAYWESRAKAARHPVLRARYADLVWEFTKPCTGNQPSYRMAQIAIDSIVDISRSSCHKYEVAVICKLGRALRLALSLGDRERVERVRDAIVQFEDLIAEDEKPGLWGFSFDLLMNAKAVDLPDTLKNKILTDLEGHLDRAAAAGDFVGAESAALRLARYYRKLNQNDDVRRVLLKYGSVLRSLRCLETTASAFQNSAWIEKIHKVYSDFGLTVEAEDLRKRLREIGPKVVGGLKTITGEAEIDIKEMRRYVDALIGGDLAVALERIAFHYIPKRQEIEQRISDLYKIAPMTFLITHQIVDHKGRPVATIGPLTEDPEGHLIRQMANDLSLGSLFLREVMAALISRYVLTANKFADILFESPIFDPAKRVLIERGLAAYLDSDYVVAAHLLIPQIEDAIRNLVEINEGDVLRVSRGGGFFLKTLDELLREPIVQSAFGPDCSLYFRVVLTDQRGWNLRNNVCHGIVEERDIGSKEVDRLIHILLCLSLVRKSRETERMS